jgi:hypothetical protein
MAVPVREQRILAQRSGNRCAFPGCCRPLTAGDSPLDGTVILGEIAHIIAESPEGPRGDSPLMLVERNKYDNLILLCNVHHQLIDDQPQTYPIERLQQMKRDHELWVERILGRGHDDRFDFETPMHKKETIHSTLLPVVRMPLFIYVADCDLSDEQAVLTRMLPLRQEEMAPFIMRSGKLIAFQDLRDAENPFRNIVSSASCRLYPTREWWDDPDRAKWVVALLNRSLNKLTGRRGLRLDKRHSRYYFQPAEAGQELTVEYQPLNQKRSSRKVVWQPKSRLTGQGRSYWYHRAVSLQFLRSGTDQWCLSIRPELHVTTDGLNPLSSEKIGSRVTRKKSRMFNYDLLGEVQFWRDYLSGSSPRIILSFGPKQHLVISTTLMQGAITWPGIPGEHTKPFKNIEYVDDLFSWAEFSVLEDDQERTDLDEWGDDDNDDE